MIGYPHQDTPPCISISATKPPNSARQDGSNKKCRNRAWYNMLTVASIATTIRMRNWPTEISTQPSTGNKVKGSNIPQPLDMPRLSNPVIPHER